MATVGPEGEPGEMWAVMAQASGLLHEAAVSRPRPESGEFLVRVLAAGPLPATVESTTRAVPAGDALRFVGLVEEGPAEAVGCAVAMIPVVPCGACEACRRGHPQNCSQPSTCAPPTPIVIPEYLAVPARHLIRLVPGRRTDEAVFLAEAARVLSAVQSACLQIGDSVAIIGLDSAAVLAAQWVRIAGAYDVFIIEQDPAALAVAQELWLGERLAVPTAEARTLVLERHHARGVELAIVPSTHAELLESAASLLEPGGRILALNVESGTGLPGSMPKGIPVVMAPASDAPLARRDWEVAARTWGSGRLILRPLLAERVPMDEVCTRWQRGESPYFGRDIAVWRRDPA